MLIIDCHAHIFPPLAEADSQKKKAKIKGKGRVALPFTRQISRARV